MKLREFFSTPEWLFRWAVLVLLVGQPFINSHYVPRDEYMTDRKGLSVTLEKINDTIIDLKTAMKIQERTTEKLSDHETRLRVLEQQRKPQ